MLQVLQHVSTIKILQELKMAPYHEYATEKYVFLNMWTWNTNRL